MPDLVFDGRQISVGPRTNLVEAGLAAGVPVPVFCYHRELGAVGSCRVCACTVTQGGKSRLAMACMTEAQDGMEVTTLDPASVELRKYVLEWLMVNHPHDCPICDEGGECQLQDLTIASGHGIRRAHGPKRTFKNQFLGEFIQHEMNRCITCYRCSRFYQEYAGGRDFGATGSRDRVYFGRFEEGPLESPFSGNLVELCPTGVFTDKLFRYRSRVWDLEISPSICPHCSVGCNLLPGSRHRELQRIRVRENPAVNGSFLCDRGQFGHAYVMDAERPRALRVHGQAATWEDALGLAGGTLLGLVREHGAASVALIGSPRASLEAHASMEAFATGPFTGVRVSHFDDPERELRALAALGALSAAGTPPLDQGEIAHCDVLLVGGASLVDEAPLAALAARQLTRRGGRLFVVNAGERYLADVAERVVPVHPVRLAETLTAIARNLAQPAGRDGDDATAIAAALRGAERPGILLGSDLLDGPAFTAGVELAQAIGRVRAFPRLGFLFPGPNGFGAAAIARAPRLGAILEDLRAGRLKAVVLVEAEPSEWSAEARQALERLGLLVVMDYLPGPHVERAGILLPTTVTYESSGIYVNRAGRAQAFLPALSPGLSVEELITRETFPRTPRLEPPEGGARPAWWALELMRERAVGKPEARKAASVRDALERSHEFWHPLRGLTAGTEGARLDPARLKLEPPRLPAFAKGTGVSLCRCERTLGSESLSRRSAPVRAMAGAPVARLGAEEAARLGVDGRITITAAGATIEMAASADPAVAPGALLVPRDAAWPATLEQGVTVQIAAARATEEIHR